MSGTIERLNGRLGPIGLAPAVLALLAVTAMIGILPALTGQTSIHHTLWIWVVAAGYALVSFLLGRPRAGLCIGLVVTSTWAFALRRASWAILSTTPGWLGPTVWLVQVPLFLFIVLFVFRILRGTASPLSLVEATFGAYVVWSSISTIFSGAPRPDTAFYFTLFLLHGWIALLAVYRSVLNEWLSFEEVTFALVVAVLGHAVVGAAQLLNQGVFGLRELGEIPPNASNPDAVVMALGPLLRFNVGLFVSGFTGNAYVLAALLVLVFPILVAAALRVEGPERVGILFLVGLSAVVLRATNSDGARGALILGIVLFVGATWYIGGRYPFILLRDRRTVDRMRTSIPTSFAVVTVITVAVLFVGFAPSTRVNGATAAAGLSETPGAVNGLSRLLIPSLSLGTLSSRLTQYTIAIDLFVRNPVFGIGGGNFQYVAVQYGLPEGMPLHNTYLILLTETGLPGFLLYVTALALVFRANGRLLRESERGIRGTALGLLAGLTGYLAYAFWDHLALDRITAFLPFWILAGAVVGAYMRHVDSTGG